MASRVRIGKKTYLMDDDWNPQPEADGPLHVGFFDSPALLTNAQRAEHDAERQARIDRQGIPQTRSRYRSYKKPSKVKSRVKAGGKRNVQPKGDANNNSGNKGGNNWFRNYFTNISNLGNTNVTNDFREKAKSILSTAKVGKKDKERMLNSLEKAATDQVTTTIPTDSIKAGNDSIRVPNDSIRVPRDTTAVSRDSLARDSVARDSLRIPRDTVPTDTIRRDSLVQRPDSIQPVPIDSLRNDTLQLKKYGMLDFYNSARINTEGKLGRDQALDLLENSNSPLLKSYAAIMRYSPDDIGAIKSENRPVDVLNRKNLGFYHVIKNDSTIEAGGNATYFANPYERFSDERLKQRDPRVVITPSKSRLPLDRKPKRSYIDATSDIYTFADITPGDTITVPWGNYIINDNYKPRMLKGEENKRANKTNSFIKIRTPEYKKYLENELNSLKERIRKRRNNSNVIERNDSTKVVPRDSLRRDSTKIHYTPDEYVKLSRRANESDSAYRRRVITFGRNQGFRKDEMDIWLKKHNLK